MADLEGRVLGPGRYRSPFRPGVGSLALLLKEEQREENIGGDAGGDDDEEDSDDDSDGEEEEDDGGGCADTLQDLHRTVKFLASKRYEGADAADDDFASGPLASAVTVPATRFALPYDAPWTGLNAPESEYAPMEGDAEDEMERRRASAVVLTFGDERVRLAVPGVASSDEDVDGGEAWSNFPCAAVPYLLRMARGDDDGSNVDAVALRCYSLEGVVFGRLSIFDAPPSEGGDGDGDDEDNDDDDEEKGEDGDGGGSNPQRDAYVKTFTLADRCLLSDAVRDCLLCHRSNVLDSGAERGTTRDVAEQIWALSHLLTKPTNTVAGGKGTETKEDKGEGDGEGGEGGEDDAMTDEGNKPDDDHGDDDDDENGPSRGLEYGIVESVLGLVAQCPPPRSGEPTGSPLSHAYLCRVLIELTKLKPDLVPQAIVAAVSTLFADFMPALVPRARENLSAWLAFHLTNTDYQWPGAFWELWTPYVSRGCGPIEDGA
eukprot:CAMPEP_0183327790 /NCGR_PEP_ID=MMETSP0160_2-20130417/83950_1 /TAXON_ID=2839 ORGANISM="Odontella Sinensis, Strain Grunow 1884" /NCGR_SAMPLE_ID=MMETSP0160_2 /ASSEMBLY_ACC=CAM_ASM_000250 /LENGTH=487 /DNA_ID=CAMNT_0025495935 /DNA_START=21 /DNA_END=1480 /DNA_ORIENTATION=-